MPTRKVKVGDALSHEGNWHGHDHEDGDFVIVGFKDGGQDPKDPLHRVKNFFCIFENRRFKVVCQTAELEWLDDDAAWMLPGRLLTRHQRQAFCVLTESPSCNPKMHLVARSLLLIKQEEALTDA